MVMPNHTHKVIVIKRDAINRVSFAFTYIELLITLAIIAVLFVPVMHMFSYTIYSLNSSKNLITATNLAKWEMERIKNFKVTKAQLKEIGDTLYPPAEEAALEMNGAKWRIKKEIRENAGALEVWVSVFLDGSPEDSVVTLVTLLEDMMWDELRPIN